MATSPAPPDQADPEADLAEALAAGAEFGCWVRNADTKAGLLAAATAVLVGALAQQTGTLGTFLAPETRLETVVLVLLVATGGGMLTTTVFLGHALIPRTPTSSEVPNRFSWPDMAEADPAQLRRGDQAAAAHEAWCQAHTVAIIAKRKFDAIRRAVWSLGGSFLAFSAWVVVAALVVEQ